MIRFFFAVLGLGSLAGPLDLEAAAGHDWEQSLVIIEITHKQYDFIQPWDSSQSRAATAGVVIGERQILTTADDMEHHTLIRLQKGGRGRWYLGEIQWIDPLANLALVTTGNAGFWEGLVPASLAESVDPEAEFQIVRWSNGLLERQRAELKRFVVERGQGNPNMVNHVHSEWTSDIQGAGWGEPLVTDGSVAGLLVSQADNDTILAIPSPFIRDILNAVEAGNFGGLGYFSFYWQPGENPNLLNRLELPGEHRGVVVIDLPGRTAENSVLQPRDIILQISGFDIDIQGDYEDPDYGYLMLENLSSRGKWAGENVEMKIWREGREQTVQYRLPKIEPAAELVPEPSFTEPPEYVIVGGLVFQPLTRGYLERWGGNWRRRAPFRLAYYEREYPTEERPSLVFLSGVLPDPFNQGYQDLRFLVVDEVNGQKVITIQDLDRAFQNPSGDFHEVNFVQGDSIQRIVLDAEAADAATRRVLRLYGIPEARVIESRED